MPCAESAESLPQGKALASSSALFNTLGAFGGFVGPYLIGALSNHGSFT